MGETPREVAPSAQLPNQPGLAVLYLYVPRREAGRIMPGPCCRAHIYGVVGKHAIRRDAFPEYDALDGSCPSGPRKAQRRNSRKHA